MEQTTVQRPRRVFLDEPRAGSLTISYAPDEGAPPTENPPRFSWLPALDDAARYALRLSRSEAFPDDATTVHEDIAWNFFTPDAVLAPGRYFWSYALWDAAAGRVVSDWSRTRSFEIAEGLPQTPLPRAGDRYRGVDMSHPRLWLRPEEVAAFRQALAADPDHCGWSRFHASSVAPWMMREIIAEPSPYPDNVRVAGLWRQMYIDCQEVIYAIRHLAIAGRVTGDEALTARAREWLLAIASWDPAGTTSRAYNDEAAFRVVTALAWGYDWLHDGLSEDERAEVRAVLLQRTREIADHVMRHARITVFPYDSHAVRALSAALAAACIALLDEEPEAQVWLDYTVDFLFTLYSPWGGADGGWAEGPHYWTTGLAYLIDAANLIRKFLGLDLYRRPFFQRTGDFPLYTKAPDTRRACFGDDSTLGDLPSLKVGYNMRQFAGVTGNGHYQWYFETVRRNAAGTEMEFYNYGWWDLAFDDLVYAHDYPAVAARAPDDLPPVKWFRDVGWVAIQQHLHDPDRHIQFLVKSSDYGSLSHSHGDQNAFLLFAYGEDLAIQSGYYVAFNSAMHREWRRQTRSKNAILIDGKGQYADRDKALARQARGRIVEVREASDHVFIRADATAAYAVANPAVSAAIRDVYFVHGEYVVLVDRVECTDALPITFLYHAAGPLEVGHNTFRYTGAKAGLYGQFVLATAGPPKLTEVVGFPGIDPAEYEGLPLHHHLRADVPAARKHTLVTLLVPYPRGDARRIFSFIDDQGFTSDVYFTDVDDRRFRIVLPKDF
ncbi:MULTISPECIES: DUF4962 domain-containing protein [unclassified Chelatococcus]|uniref:DUF4962 domain-containing protein n=1 Tax=unclassified Chelatococcus TaxID=2638111 RepID=UPI0002DE5225|nr:MULTISPECIES: DUF4962 domain-containing protein [unclassified Chelatococcus]ALA16874.1 alginate lyase [Chelatococcus sp. CO-6]